MSKKESITTLSKVKKDFDFIGLLKNIALPLGGGIIVGLLTKGTMDTYDKLKKPIFVPPNIVFPIVWIILYILIGVAAYRIYEKNKKGFNDNGAYFYYLVQLLINFLWPFIFFSFRLYGIALVIIIILLILAIITAIKFYKSDKIAGILLMPYIIWISYATILNYYIWILNEA